MSIRRWKVNEVRDQTKFSYSLLLIHTQPWLEIKCVLGEGPYYSQDRNQLRFVVSREVPGGLICL
jgi:hypothetical protein